MRLCIYIYILFYTGQQYALHPRNLNRLTLSMYYYTCRFIATGGLLGFIAVLYMHERRREVMWVSTYTLVDHFLENIFYHFVGITCTCNVFVYRTPVQLLLLELPVWA